VDVSGLWVFAAVIASVSGPNYEGKGAHLAVVRSLETDHSSTGTMKPHIRTRSHDLVADDTRIVARVYPVLAPLMGIPINVLIQVIILPDPHVINTVGLLNSGHSAGRDNPGLKINVEVSARPVRLHVSLEPSLHLLAVPSTERRLVVTYCKRDDEVVLVQVGVRSGGMKVVANFARRKVRIVLIFVPPVDGLRSRIS